MTAETPEIIGIPLKEQTPDEIEEAAKKFGFVRNFQVTPYEDEQGEGLQIVCETEDFRSSHKLKIYDGNFYEIIESTIYYQGRAINVLDAARRLIGENVTPVVSRGVVIPQDIDTLPLGTTLTELPKTIQEVLLYGDHSYIDERQVTDCPLPITFGGLYVFFHELAHANDPNGNEVVTIANNFWKTTDWNDSDEIEFNDGLTAAGEILLEKFAFEQGLGALRSIFPDIPEPEIAFVAMYMYELARSQKLDLQKKTYSSLVHNYDHDSEYAQKIKTIGEKYNSYLTVFVQPFSLEDTLDKPAPDTPTSLAPDEH